MDGDLQDEPAEIPRFLAKLEDGFDLVSGWKRKRNDPLGKVLPSRIFNYLVRITTGVRVHDVNCGFKAYRGNLARSLRLYGELHRFVPVLAAARGYRVAEIEVTHHARTHGRSKYGVSRFIRGLFDLVTVLLVTRYGDRPAHGFGYVALGFLAAGILVAALNGLFTRQARLDLLAAVLLAGCLVMFAAGWTAEIVVARDRPGEPAGAGCLEERLD